VSLTATYLFDLSRVRLTADTLGATATYAVVEQSAQAGFNLADTVRGGTALPVSSQEAQLDDYEFYADAPTHYRITSFDASDVQQAQFTTSITVDLAGEVWLKSVRYPLLNQVVRVSDYGDLSMAARSAALPISGRSLPVGVGDLHGGRDHPLVVATDTPAQAAKLDLSLRAGGTWFVHVPTNPPVGRAGNALLPGSMHVLIGAPRVVRIDGVAQVQLHVLPLTEVAAPAPEVVGVTLTWETVRRLYGSWTAVWAAHSTWRSLWDTIGDPSDVVT
jgi:hypothetical protein